MRSLHRFLSLIALALMGTCALRARAADFSLPTLTPEELVKALQAPKGPKPLLFQVGSHMLYVQAHIPGSEYLGAGSTEVGIRNLRQRAQRLPKNSAIVLYCGCCPWSHCPNLNPAYDALRQMGFTNVKVLHLASNFGADWVDKGYPVAKGE
ncbi:MAG: rhodanese-like domain-containing protein [Terriglobales bacterium]